MRSRDRLSLAGSAKRLAASLNREHRARVFLESAENIACTAPEIKELKV